MLTQEQRDSIDGLCEKYRSHLSIEQIAEGIEHCIRNATELYNDGCVLLSGQRFARSVLAFIASMEEIGKTFVLCSMARIPKNNQSLWAEFWAEFRSHEEKTTRAFVQTYADEVRANPALLLAAAKFQRGLAPAGERLRQASVYVDFHARDKRWIIPEEYTAYDAEQWQRRSRTVIERTQAFSDLGLHSLRALEIQREVYGPLNATRPKRKEMDAATVEAISEQSREKHAIYFRRCVEEGESWS